MLNNDYNKQYEQASKDKEDDVGYGDRHRR